MNSFNVLFWTVTILFVLGMSVITITKVQGFALTLGYAVFAALIEIGVELRKLNDSNPPKVLRK